MSAATDTTIATLSDLDFVRAFASLPREALKSAVAMSDDDEGLALPAVRQTVKYGALGSRRHGVQVHLSADRDGWRSGRTLWLAFPV